MAVSTLSTAAGKPVGGHDAAPGLFFSFPVRAGPPARATLAVMFASVMAASVRASPSSSFTIWPRANTTTRSHRPASSMPSDDDTTTATPLSASSRRRS